jgi:hypothetical protein
MFPIYTSSLLNGSSTEKIMWFVYVALMIAQCDDIGYNWRIFLTKIPVVLDDEHFKLFYPFVKNTLPPLLSLLV